MVWVDNQADTLVWAERLLGTEGERIGQAGREWVLAQHPYAHRLVRITEVML